MPWGCRVGILVAVGVVLVMAPLNLSLTRLVPRIANAKSGPTWPVLSENGRILFNAVLYAIMAIGGTVILLVTNGNEKTTVGARLGIGAGTLVFTILSITEFIEWWRGRIK